MNPLRSTLSAVLILLFVAPGFAADGGTETVRVRVVRYGMSYGSFPEFPTYREVLGQPKAKVFDAITGVDVDGNPSTSDVIAAAPFSMERSMSPQIPNYNEQYRSAKFYGGYTIYFANRDKPAMTEIRVNEVEGQVNMKPYNNWAFHALAYKSGSPMKGYGAFIWKKEDFLQGGDKYPVSFDQTSRINLLTMRYQTAFEGVRFVVREGGRFYLSEVLKNDWKKDAVHSMGGVQLREFCPVDLEWGEWNPKEGEWDVMFDPATPMQKREFKDVTAVGWYIFKDTLDDEAVAVKWYSFDCFANVTRPAKPGWELDMVKVGDFFIGKSEVPYSDWRRIFAWNESQGQWASEPPPYHFDRDGDMGSMFATDGSHLHAEPATRMSYHDALLWCNALSETEGRRPVYYVDPEFKTPLRYLVFSPFNKGGNPVVAAQENPTVYVDWAADGYRLPTPSEWAEATGDWKAAAGSEKRTSPSASGEQNKNGLFGTGGNVWEYLWTYGDSMPWQPDKIVAAGGDFAGTKPGDHSASPYGDTPYEGAYNIGFRPVRKDKGSKKPDTAFQAATAKFPVWEIAKESKTVTRTPEALNLEMVKIPGGKWQTAFKDAARSFEMTPFEMGKTEITYRQWAQVYQWARENGYSFDRDGDMGSMDLKMYEFEHAPDEPVTHISWFDTLAWCNALSEMQGKTPVFYEDEACTEVYRKSWRYRPRELRAWDMVTNHDNKSFYEDWNGRKVVHMRWDADGFRPPTIFEWGYAYAGGSRETFPWGADFKGIEDFGWWLGNSGDRTHTVGKKQPNGFGLLDMTGNVQEWVVDSCTKRIEMERGQKKNPIVRPLAYQHSSEARASSARVGFLDYLDRGNFESDILDMNNKWRAEFPGWYFPDIGFRICRRAAGDYPRGGIPEDRAATSITPVDLTR